MILTDKDVADARVGVLAAKAGMTAEAFLYDHMTAGDGSNVAIDNILNYTEGNLDSMYGMRATRW